MPQVLEDYPNTRSIIDATEFSVERPSSLLSQSCTFSLYKNKKTVKLLVGIMPSGQAPSQTNTHVTIGSLIMKNT